MLMSFCNITIVCVFLLTFSHLLYDIWSNLAYLGKKQWSYQLFIFVSKKSHTNISFLLLLLLFLLLLCKSVWPANVLSQWTLSNLLCEPCYEKSQQVSAATRGVSSSSYNNLHLKGRLQTVLSRCTYWRQATKNP
jgi:hypothetical protein